MTDVWISLLEDRHVDADPRPFSTEEAAVAYARSAARDCALDPGDVTDEPLSDAMVRDGWVLYLSYGTEGDSVRVMRRELDAVPDE